MQIAKVALGCIIGTMNTTQDVLNILLTLGVLIITVCVVYITYYLVQALRSVTNLANSLGKVKVLAAIPALLIALASKIIKKGR